VRRHPDDRPGLAGRPTPRQLAELRRVIAALESEGQVNVAPGAGEAPAGELAPVAAEPRFADLTARELIELLPSLERPGLEALRAHEREHAARRTVLAAIDALLARDG
jgi:hypothetical protein